MSRKHLELLVGACLLLMLLALIFGIVLMMRPVVAQDRGIDWLVLVVDRSDSIDSNEYALQRDAYVQALPQPQVADQVRQVAIVEFGSKAQVVVDWTDPKTASEVYAKRGGGSVGYGGGYNMTAIGRGLQAAIRLLDGKSGRQVIDVSGDGVDNVDPALLRRMQEHAAWHGVEINGLAVRPEGVGASDLPQYYRERVATGFAMSATGWEDFQRALIAKLSMEIAGGPYRQFAEVTP